MISVSAFVSVSSKVERKAISSSRELAFFSSINGVASDIANSSLFGSLFSSTALISLLEGRLEMFLFFALAFFEAFFLILLRLSSFLLNSPTKNSAADFVIPAFTRNLLRSFLSISYFYLLISLLAKKVKIPTKSRNFLKKFIFCRVFVAQSILL